MRLIFLLVLFLNVVHIKCESKNSDKARIEIDQDSGAKWENIIERIVQMIENSDAYKRQRINVKIISLDLNSLHTNYEGFHQTFSKYSNKKWTVKSIKYSPQIQIDVKDDFLIILINGNYYGYKNLIKYLFQHTDKSLKIFVVIQNHLSLKIVQDIWSSLIFLRFSNLYFILYKNVDEFYMYRTSFWKEKEIIATLTNSDDIKFLLAKDAIKIIFPIGIVHYDNYPMSYIKDGQIVGANGNMIMELSNKLNTTFYTVNQPSASSSFIEIYKHLSNFGDISIAVTSYPIIDGIYLIWLNEKEGLCLLAPRNIPVSSFENIKLPLDKPTLIMSLISTILVILCWICITNEMSILSIVFAVYELILNLGASGLERLTMRENILVYPFIFSSFILVSYYESLFLTLMFTEPSMRSAYNLEELNASNTKFYSFYDEKIARHAKLPSIREDLIVNYIDISVYMPREIPKNFDKNLVYLVFCKYADSFIKSSLNYHESKRLFDKIEIAQGPQAYAVSSAYFYIEEFKAIVSQIIESGIYEYWEMKTLEDVHDNTNDKNMTGEHDLIEFGGMVVPISVLIFGALVALSCFLIELIVYRWKNCFMNRFNNVQNIIGVQVSRRKLKLDNWKTKYLLKKKSLKKIPPKIEIKQSQTYIKSNSNHGHIECRESIKGGYFIFWKVQKLKEKRRKITQVQPCPVKNECISVVDELKIEI